MNSNWTKENIAWVSGLFEGEGTVGAYTRKSKEYLHSNGRWYKHKEVCKIAVRIGMTDVDVLLEAADILNLGEVYGPYKVTGGGHLYMKGKEYKNRYNLEIFTFEKVQQAMILMWPWLSRRRRLQFEEAVVKYLDYSGRS